MSDETRLQGKAAVITGANQGIGAAMAKAFAAEGARLHLLDRKDDRIAEVAEAARTLGVEVSHGTVDVTDPGAVESAMEAAAERLGGIDILANCAGVFHSTPFMDYSLDDWNRVMTVNVTGTLLCCQAALRRMLPRGYGKIVNMSSVAGKRGVMYGSAYAASKHAVIGITRSVALEVAAHGITVNAICPGYIDTEMYDIVLRDTGARLGMDDIEAVRSRLLKNVPIGRMIAPEEIARLAVYLAAPDSDGMTGQALTFSGGMHLA